MSKFLNFIISSHWKSGKRHGPSFEQTWIPFIKGCLCQGWLKLAQLFWRRFFKICKVFLRFPYFLPLEKGTLSLHFSKLKLTPFTQRCLEQSLVNIGPVDLENKMKMWKVYDNDDDSKHDDANIQILIRNAHLSLQLSLFYKNLKLQCQSMCKITQTSWSRTVKLLSKGQNFVAYYWSETF